MPTETTQAVPHKLPRLMKAVIWILRIFVGCTFMFSGFVKTIDPWGFIYKIEEYLNVWGIYWLWRETVLCIAVTISITEYCCGFAMLTGCLRKLTSWIIALFMLVMLPLTAYIAIANPVSDCGCFGDALVISNTATFVKNILLTAAIIFLLKYNSKIDGLYPPLSQVLPMLLSVFYCIIIAFTGITVQPLMDFRPYKIGSALAENTASEISLIYEKDGERHTFSLEELPDSTWTYVGRETPEKESEISPSLAIFDSEDEVTEEVLSDSGPQVLLIIPDVHQHQKSRSSMANTINDYVTSQGGNMIGIVGSGDEGLEMWKKLAKPHFEVYTAEDTQLKELVRGDAGIVYLLDGKIKWKRNMFSLPGDFPDFMAEGNELDRVYVIDSGEPLKYLTAIYVGALLILYLLGLIRIKNSKKSTEKKS